MAIEGPSSGGQGGIPVYFYLNSKDDPDVDSSSRCSGIDAICCDPRGEALERSRSSAKAVLEDWY